jgi:hypothetical protein
MAGRVHLNLQDIAQKIGVMFSQFRTPVAGTKKQVQADKPG